MEELLPVNNIPSQDYPYPDDRATRSYVSVTDTVTEVMSSGIFKEFMQRLGGAEHDFWELERLGITTVDYSKRSSLA